MKKLTLIVLSLLLILGLCSCGGGTPTAKELIIEAGENTKAYNFDGKIELAVIEEGISTAMNIGLDGTFDGENMKSELNIGIPYINLTGEMYFIKDELTVYMNMMGAWMKMDLNDLAAMGMVDMNELELLQNQKLTEDMLTQLGFTFSEVTEADGIYTFDIGYDKTVWKTMLAAQLSQQLSDGTMTLPEGYTEDEFVDMILPVLDSLKITTNINKSDKTLLAMKADFMPVFEAVAQINGIGEEIPVTKCAFEFNISDVGKVSKVEIDKSAADSAIDLVQYLNDLNSLAY